ncbi:uncharacterized protein LOC105833153 isoform X3 [Monomorium pharaonis]|uniref:uncharacterized protein LOC105833153 isoform X3 n=1 Tax=Monomorium pharaonis TaxID=307658 RepID=UPI00102E1070|nr:uncharacterized protein LOC105833153 isoform X3 [Monomorium pharaonis]
MIVNETVINTGNLMAIQFKSETDDSLIITEDDDMEISIILGNEVQESISTEETIINTNLINTQLKREIDDPVMEHDTNMEISVISENKMHDNTSINDTIMNTNSTDIQLKRKTNNSIIRRRNPRYVGDLCREDFTSDGTWRLFKEHLVNTRTKIKALNQKIVYLNRKVDRLRKKALMDALSSDNEDSGNNLETTHQRKIPKLKNFAEVIVPRWKEEEFKSHFRMSRNIFEFVLSLIAPKLKRHHPGLEMISAEKQFLITIWRMASPDTYKSICERFNVSRSTAVSTTRRVTKALADLAPMFIKWPVKNSVQEVWAGFEAISAFPKVIGAIDGIYINIPSPRVNPEDYVDKKGDL